jgi:hypothetical protein
MMGNARFSDEFKRDAVRQMHEYRSSRFRAAMMPKAGHRVCRPPDRLRKTISGTVFVSSFK